MSGRKYFNRTPSYWDSLYLNLTHRYLRRDSPQHIRIRQSRWFIANLPSHGHFPNPRHTPNKCWTDTHVNPREGQTSFGKQYLLVTLFAAHAVSGILKRLLVSSPMCRRFTSLRTTVGYPATLFSPPTRNHSLPAL